MRRAGGEGEQQREWFFHVSGPASEALRQRLADALRVDSLKCTPTTSPLQRENSQLGQPRSRQRAPHSRGARLTASVSCI